jgi:hypothetical protein
MIADKPDHADAIRKALDKAHHGPTSGGATARREADSPPRQSTRHAN